MLRAEVLFPNSLLSQSAVTTDHLFLRSLHFLLDSFHGAVRIAPEKGIVAFIALIVKCQVLRDLLFFQICSRVLILWDLIPLQVHDSIRDDVSLQGSNLAHFLVELGNGISSCNVFRALRAPEESPRYVLFRPACAEMIAETLGVEDMTATYLYQRLLILSVNFKRPVAFFTVD